MSCCLFSCESIINTTKDFFSCMYYLVCLLKTIRVCICGGRCFSRDWQVVDYGMCDLMDLLTEIPDTTITITQQDSDTVISVPKKGEDSQYLPTILKRGVFKYGTRG